MGVTGRLVAVALTVTGALQLVAGCVVLAYVLGGPLVAAAAGLVLGGLLTGGAGLLVVNVSSTSGGKR